MFLFRKQPKTFAFDHCFYSVDSGREDFASQEVVFNFLGRDILDNAFQGYNACIFAYGQTGKCFMLIPRYLTNVNCLSIDFSIVSFLTLYYPRNLLFRIKYVTLTNGNVGCACLPFIIRFWV